MRTWLDSSVLRRSFLCVACFALAIEPALGGVNRWSGNAPGHATIARVMSDPSDAALIYAVTTGGSIVKSADGGSSWKESDQGLPALSISEIFIKPGVAGTLFVAIGSDVFISTDAAGHWSKAGTIGTTLPISTMAFESAAGLLYAGGKGGLFVSDDNGRTWRRAGYSSIVTSVVVSPKGTVLIGSERFGLYGSIDHGKTWSFLHGGSPRALVAVDQNSTIYWFEPGTLSASSDEGKTWHLLPPPPGASSNIGGTILPLLSVKDGDGELINPNISIPAPGDLFALGTRTIYEYTDSSGAWKPVGSPIPDGSPLSMAITPSGQRKYWVTTTAGGLLVSDGGDWTALNQGLGASIANDVAVVASSPSAAYAATDDGLFRTVDHGADWIEITPAGPKKTFSVAVDPGLTDSVYTSTDKLYKSTDSGSSWTGILGSHATILSVSPSHPARIYAALSDRLLKSENSGNSWFNVYIGFAYYEIFYYGGATALAEDPAIGDAVYVGIAGGGGLYRVAAEYSAKPVLNGTMRAIAVAPNESVVFASPEGPGLIKSTDRGATWSTAGLIDKGIRALLLAGPDRSILYAGSADGHVYRSTDSGNSWQGIGTGLDRWTINRLAADSTGKVLYAATDTGPREYESITIQPNALPDDPLRFPGLLSRAVGDSLVVLPVAGTATGGLGILYTTDVTLANLRDATQDVILTWLPQAGVGVTSFHMTLATSGIVTLPDFAQLLGVSGIGSLAIVGVDSKGNADPGASISASADIWSHPTDRRAPFAQTVNAIPRQTALGHTQSELTGLQHDVALRTNIGIVNLSGDAHAYSVAAHGERDSSAFAVIVPPFSLLQMAVPEKDYGGLTIDITADASANWVAYGSTIDRITGVARTNNGN